MKIAAYNPSEAEVRREWTGEERRAPRAVFVAPKLAVKRDHFALIVLAVVVAAAALAVVVL